MSHVYKHPTCPHCGSSEIRSDAYASWNQQFHAWELENTYETYFCADCEADDIDPIWKEDE